MLRRGCSLLFHCIPKAVVRLGHPAPIGVIHEQPKGYHSDRCGVALGERPWSED